MPKKGLDIDFPIYVVWSFLSILSIKCRNWFYCIDRTEAAERAKSKEFPCIHTYLRLCSLRIRGL